MTRTPPEKRPDRPPEVQKCSGQPKRIVGGTVVMVQKREYRLLTPLYGGGVKPNEADPVTIIRATEIRGELRFWWRAMRGWQSAGDVKKLKELEDTIWGAASTTKREKEEQQTGDSQEQENLAKKWQEAVQLLVEIKREGKLVKPFKPQPKYNGGFRAQSTNNIPEYAAFPLRPEDKALNQYGENTPIKDLYKDVAFLLTITFPEQWKDEIEAALWAWETFGGIGARTRRGFGSLHLERLDGRKNQDLPQATVQAVRTWLAEKLKHWIQGEQYPDHVPHLSQRPCFRLLDPPADPVQVWGLLIEKLKGFRQWRRTFRDERNKNKPRFERSDWPEAEAIRDLTKERAEFRRPLGHPKKFPRAALGLPIVFHFKDEKKGDPFGVTLQGPEGMDRLASPLILRPLICQGGQAFGLALCLEGVRLPEKLILEGQAKDWGGQAPKKELDKSKAELTPGEAAALNRAARQPRPIDLTDILQAFLDYLDLDKGKNNI